MQAFLSNYARAFNVDKWWRIYTRAKKGGVLHELFTLRYMRYASKSGGYVGRETVIDGKPNLPHGFHGIHISREAHIGKNVTIYQNVTVGAGHGGAAIIEDDVMIGANAVIIGGVHIGAGAKIGAGAIVVENVMPGKTVVSPKAIAL